MNTQIEILIGNAFHKILRFKFFVMKLILYKIFKTKSDDKPQSQTSSNYGSLWDIS